MIASFVFFGGKWLKWFARVESLQSLCFFWSAEFSEIKLVCIQMPYYNSVVITPYLDLVIYECTELDWDFLQMGSYPLFPLEEAGKRTISPFLIASHTLTNIAPKHAPKKKVRDGAAWERRQMSKTCLRLHVAQDSPTFDSFPFTEVCLWIVLIEILFPSYAVETETQ